MKGEINMNITLTDGQSNAFKKGKKWYKKQNKQVFRIAGYAGTGKSTIVFALIEELGLNPMKDVLFYNEVIKFKKKKKSLDENFLF